MSFLSTFLAYAQEQTEAPVWFQLAPMVIVVFVFYFLLMRPQMKQQKEHQNLINNIKVGDKVITSGGIWGEVDAIDNQTVRLKTGEKNKLVVSRSHISGLQGSPEKDAAK